MNSNCKYIKTITLSVLIFFLCVNSTFGAIKMNATAISGGEGHTLVLGENGQPFACGYNGNIANYWGVLGTGGTGYNANYNEPRLVRVHGPDDIGFLGNIDEIAAGWSHSMARSNSGFVWAWGDDGDGQLGNGAEGSKTYPIHVLSGEQDPNNDDTFLKYIIDISAGRSGNHSLAVDANGFCYAWGLNNLGQLGDGSTANRYTPVEVNDTNDTGRLENIIAVSAGEEHSMALDGEGFVWCWGVNKYLNNQKGKLGTGNEVSDYNHGF